MSKAMNTRTQLLNDPRQTYQVYYVAEESETNARLSEWGSESDGFYRHR